jgi:hypothetical protein
MLLADNSCPFEQTELKVILTDPFIVPEGKYRYEPHIRKTQACRGRMRHAWVRPGKGERQLYLPYNHNYKI